MSKNPAKKGLGRGFSSLVPDEFFDESFDPTAAQDEQVSDLRNIKLDQVRPDPDQPRREFEQAALEQLAASIREHGVLQPIVVVARDGGYMIVAGERRWRASKLAGLDKIPSLVRTLSDQHKLELSLIENIQRKDLSPLETATAYLKLRDQFNMSLETIATRMGSKSISGVSNKMRLLKLPVVAQQALAKGEITEGQARPLIGLSDEVIGSILASIIHEEWSARRVEQYIVDLKKSQGGAIKETKQPGQVVSTAYIKQKEHLMQRYATDIKIRTNTRGAGQIVIAFKDDEEFTRIQKLLG